MMGCDSTINPMHPFQPNCLQHYCLLKHASAQQEPTVGYEAFPQRLQRRGIAQCIVHGIVHGREIAVNYLLYMTTNEPTFEHMKTPTADEYFCMF